MYVSNRCCWLHNPCTIASTPRSCFPWACNASQWAISVLANTHREPNKHLNMSSARATGVYDFWNDQTALHLCLCQNSHSTRGGEKAEPRCFAVLCIPSQVLHPQVESLCFYIGVIGSHKSLMNARLCQKDVHFTTWSLCGFARQQGWDEITHRENSVVRSSSSFTSPLHRRGSWREWQQLWACVCIREDRFCVYF